MDQQLINEKDLVTSLSEFDFLYNFFDLNILNDILHHQMQLYLYLNHFFKRIIEICVVRVFIEQNVIR